ncbi:hypothetical protein BKI52_23215 [marine bacterium AO1-C]|nr:hypothetical protein BKI52_23215 [marine bacterium AO1-C]
MTQEEKAREAIRRNEALQIKLADLMQEVDEALEKTRQVNEEVMACRIQPTAYAPSDNRTF